MASGRVPGLQTYLIVTLGIAIVQQGTLGSNGKLQLLLFF